MRMDVNFRETEDTFGVELDEGSENLPVRFGEAQTVTERDYDALNNKPQINGVTLEGDITGADIGLDFSNEISNLNGICLVGSPGLTERVSGGTKLSNQIWLQHGCFLCGYYLEVSTTKMWIYGIFSGSHENAVTFKKYLLYKQNPDFEPYEFTYENAPSKLEIDAGHNTDLYKFRTNFTINREPKLIDIRLCMILYDASGNEVERMYSDQYRYTASVQNESVTRVRTPTEKTSANYVVDAGVYKQSLSIAKTFDYSTPNDLTLYPLVSTMQEATFDFIIPDSAFEGADHGLSLVVKTGDGMHYVSSTFSKAEDPPYYTKPSSGIPETDMEEAVQTSLGKADTAYQLPDDGIPHTDLANAYAGAAVAGGVADGAQAIPYGEVDSTSTATVFTATVPGITALKHGTIVLLKNGVITSASGFTVNINGLGAKPVYSSMSAAAAETTLFNVNYTLLLIYDEVRVSGGCWLNYRGYNSDTNTIGYQIRSNNTVLKTTDKNRYYKIFFTSQDGTHWIPASADSANSATSAKTVNQKKIDPFGRIVYTSATTSYAAEADIAAGTIWDRYNLTLGYSFNRTGSALTLTAKTPVYVKCAPQTDGSAIMDSTTPIVQALPTTNDGKIYIFLGVATSATQVELALNHPVYWHNGTGIRLWTGGT